MYVVGFDLSLTGSGVAHGGERTGSSVFGQKGVTQLPLATRYGTIKDLALNMVVMGTTPGMDLKNVQDYRVRELPALAMIEAPDTSRAYGGLPERLYLYGCVVEMLSGMGVPVGIVPSPILKGYATGNGGSKGGKPRIKQAAAGLWPEYFEGRPKVTFDEADAIVLAQMGWDRLTGRSRVPKAQRNDWLNRPSVVWPSELETYAGEAA